MGWQGCAQGSEDLQGWVLETVFNQWPQHRMRVLMKFGTGEELGSIASTEENRTVAQKEAKTPKHRSEIRFGGMQ